MQSQDGSFGCCIVDDSSRGDEACHACNANDMALVLPYHFGHEFSNHGEMADNVDLENLLSELICLIENGSRPNTHTLEIFLGVTKLLYLRPNTSIVNENCRSTPFLTHSLRSFVN